MAKQNPQPRYEEQEEHPDLHFDMNVIRIGDIAFTGFPYELFSEIGMRINKAVPDLNILSLSNTNGSKGYFPTQDQLCRGGYEVTMFKYNGVQCLRDDADYHLMKETIRNLNNLKR